MCGGKCSTCNKVFVEPGSFENHDCVIALRELPMEELLKRLYASGGCSKEYYEAEIAKLVLEKEEL